MATENRRSEAFFPHYAMSQEDVAKQFPYGLPIWLQPRALNSSASSMPRPFRTRRGVPNYVFLAIGGASARRRKACPIFPVVGLVSNEPANNLYATAICRVVGPSPSSVVRRMSRTSLVSL
jgi:hypothetical protein